MFYTKAGRILVLAGFSALLVAASLGMTRPKSDKPLAKSGVTAEKASKPAAQPKPSAEVKPVWMIPLVVVKYFPVAGDKIDIAVTGDWGATLASTQKKVQAMQKETMESLTQGSRYHAYKDPKARPSLGYKVLKTYEFKEALPTVLDKRFKARGGRIIPKTDYNAIMKRINAKHWVEKKGVKEIWIWAYHGGRVVLWESNMSSPYGDVSNSNRDPNDLPVFKRTYTVYHYNYQRSTHEAVHNHFHQIEHLLNHIDGRHRTPRNKWGELLFWGKFVGSDITHKIIHPRCGWCHYPPNGERDYDYSNKRYVETDIEDWKPDGTGKKKRINCDRWEGNDLKFYIYWFQSLPGYKNGLKYKGRELENWWIFTGDWDYVMKNKIGLLKGKSR